MTKMDSPISLALSLLGLEQLLGAELGPGVSPDLVDWVSASGALNKLLF